MNQSIYARRWLHCATCDGLQVWLQTALFTHCENQPFKVGSSACECVSVWSAGLWQSAAQLRRGGTHTTRRALRSASYSSAGCRTVPAAPCYAQDLCFCLCSCCLFPAAHTLSSGSERSVLKSSCRVGTNCALIAHTSRFYPK